MDILEPNMYVRTKQGYIAKFKEYDEIFDVLRFETPIFLRSWMPCDYMQKERFVNRYFLKASHNIIDLIQVGDYVNGEQVRYIEKDTDYCVLAIDEDYTYIIAGYDCDGFTKPIKSIVTKEMYSSVEYKVGE